MHESGMMKGLMRQIDAAVEQQGGTRVVAVKVSIGIVTQMSADHFRGHFEEAAAGTMAEGATLRVDIIEDLANERALDVFLESVEVEG